MLAWARDNGIELLRITCGSCSVDVAPPRLASKPSEERGSVSRSLYSQLGGELFEKAVEGGDLDPAQLVPAVGRR